MSNYIIEFDVFEAASLFASGNDIRYYLNGVHLNKNRVESTNGHMGYMAKMDINRDIPSNIKGSLIYPNVMIKTKNKIPQKTKKNKIMYVSITLGDDPRIDYIDQFGDKVASDLIEIIDGRFPNLAKIFSDSIKKEPKGECFGINANYAAVFSKVMKREGFPIIKFHPKSSREAVLITFDRIHLIGVKESSLIMPARV